MGVLSVGVFTVANGKALAVEGTEKYTRNLSKQVMVDSEKIEIKGKISSEIPKEIVTVYDDTNEVIRKFELPTDKVGTAYHVFDYDPVSKHIIPVEKYYVDEPENIDRNIEFGPIIREITERLNNTSVYTQDEKDMVLNTINGVYVTGERITLELDKLNAFDKILALEYLEQASKDTAISRIKTAFSSDHVQELVDKFIELNEANKPAEPTPEKPAEEAPAQATPEKPAEPAPVAPAPVAEPTLEKPAEAPAETTPEKPAEPAPAAPAPVEEAPAEPASEKPAEEAPAETTPEEPAEPAPAAPVEEAPVAK